jgi:hypothetical protein
MWSHQRKERMERVGEMEHEKRGRGSRGVGRMTPVFS